MHGRNLLSGKICQSLCPLGLLASNLKRVQYLLKTTAQKKNGFLLIEVFRKPVNPQNYGHQGSILGGYFVFLFLC
jgi:hypothetical protein